MTGVHCSSATLLCVTLIIIYAGSNIKRCFLHETKDPQEIMVGSYQTRHFDICPGASSLYKDIESKVDDILKVGISYLGLIITHEEGHRSVLTNLEIAADKALSLIAVS